MSRAICPNSKCGAGLYFRSFRTDGKTPCATYTECLSCGYDSRLSAPSSAAIIEKLLDRVAELESTEPIAPKAATEE